MGSQNYRVEVLNDLVEPYEPPPDVPEMAKVDDKETQARLKRDHDDAVSRRKNDINRLEVDKKNRQTIRTQAVKEVQEWNYAIVRNDTNKPVALVGGAESAHHVVRLLDAQPLR